MSKLGTTEEIDYNEEPVMYCQHCLSIRIKSINEFDFCDDCGSTQMNKTNVYEWEEMYESKYGLKYLNIKKNGKERSK